MNSFDIVYVKNWMVSLIRKERKKPDKVKKVLTDLGLFLADLGEVSMIAWAKKLDTKRGDRKIRATG